MAKVSRLTAAREDLSYEEMFNQHCLGATSKGGNVKKALCYAKHIQYV